MECPQEFPIQGLSSKTFFVKVYINVKDVELYIESLLSDIMDSIGDTFTLTINKDLNRESSYDNIYYFYFTINTHYIWLADFAKKLEKIHDKIKILNVGIPNFMHGQNILSFRAKDSVYL